MPESTPRTFSIAVSATISAAPASCYEALADYRVAHPKIVPPRYFGPLEVVQGGVGAGTRFTCSLKLMGMTQPFSCDVIEPVPGRVLVETIIETGAVTTFTVVDDGKANARVTFETKRPRAKGLRGTIERLVTRRAFPGIYVEELERLAAYVGGKVIGQPGVVLDG
jgi:hypothetical protein